MSRRLLRPSQVARVIGYSVRTVRRWMAAGELPSVVVQGYRRCPSDALERYLADLSARARRFEGADGQERP